jgi:hypothetical protein
MLYFFKNYKWVYTLQFVVGLCVALFFTINIALAEVEMDYFDTYTNNTTFDSWADPVFTYNSGGGSMYRTTQYQSYSGSQSISGLTGQSASTRLDFASSSQVYFSYRFYIDTTGQNIQNFVVFDDIPSTSFHTNAFFSLEITDGDLPTNTNYCTGATNLSVFSYASSTEAGCVDGYGHDCDSCELLYESLAYNYWHLMEIYVDMETSAVFTRLDNGDSWREVETKYNSNEFNVIRSVKHRLLEESGNTNFYFDDFSLGLNEEYTAEFLDPDVVVEDLPEWGGNIQIGSETLLQYNRYNFCYLDNECSLKINYNFDVIGDQLSLYTLNDVLVSSTTLLDQQYLTVYFDLDTQSSATNTQYCVHLDNGSFPIVRACDLNVEWLAVPYCSELDMCSDVSTSSDFLYGLECGARRTLCWMLKPTDNSLEFLSKNIQNFENNFPLNLVFGLINQISYIMENATTTGSSFGLPMVSISTGDFYIYEGIDSNAYYNVLGTSTVEIILENANYFIWTIVAIIIVFVIVKYTIL